MKLRKFLKSFFNKLSGTTPNDRKYQVKLYSGGTVVGTWITSSFARNEFGAAFQDAESGDLIQITGTIVATPYKEPLKAKIGLGSFERSS